MKSLRERRISQWCQSTCPLKILRPQSSDKTQKGATSPVTVPAQLVLKTKSQGGRVQALNNLRSQLPTHAHATSINKITLIIDQVEEIHSTFCKEHEYLEAVWPSKFLDHDYFEKEVAAEEQQLVWTMKILLNWLKEDVEAIMATRPAASSSSASRASKLPEIQLPKFSGNYSQWPAYSELLRHSSSTTLDWWRAQRARPHLPDHGFIIPSMLGGTQQQVLK